MTVRRRRNPEQVVRLLAQADRMLARGMHVGDVCDALQVSASTYTHWRRRFGVLTVEQARRLGDLAHEIATLRRLLIDAEREETELLRLAGVYRSPAEASAAAADALAASASASEQLPVVDQSAVAGVVAAASLDRLREAISRILGEDEAQDHGLHEDGAGIRSLHEVGPPRGAAERDTAP
jgi:putative transposase